MHIEKLSCSGHRLVAAAAVVWTCTLVASTPVLAEPSGEEADAVAGEGEEPAQRSEPDDEDDKPAKPESVAGEDETPHTGGILTGTGVVGPSLPPGTPLVSLYGSLESDVGYANYDAQEPATIDDTFQDHRGRFVFAPFLHMDVGDDHFFEATGQLVGWIKDQVGRYQVNVDDVWGRFGKTGLWDVQVGRFEAWVVYNKFPLRDRDPRPGVRMVESTGAFDLFTLEDTGALCTPPVSTGGYCVDIYELNHILLREEAGSVAFHLYPTQTLRFELHGKYGETGQQNQRGVRLAGIWRPLPFIQLSAGGEIRQERTTSPPKLPDPDSDDDEAFIACADCGREDKQGVGGGAVLFLGPVEISANVAVGIVDTYQAVNGQPLPDASPTLISYGGYGQVDVGPVTVGGALNITERTDPSNNYQRHIQSAGYVYYPFARDLSLKLVVTYAEGLDDPFNLRDSRGALANTFTGARLRLKYLFNTF